MTRVLAGAACACFVLVVGAGCGGSSSGGGTASSSSAPASSPSSSSTTAAGGQSAVCQKVAQDAEALSQVQAGGSPSKEAAELRKAAKQMSADAASGSAQLKDGVSKLSSVLDQAATALSHHKKPNLSKFGSTVQSAESELNSACPNAGPSPSTSSS
jgi:X-X-X-Leu-X-X-Gly heptad repeat protein